MAIKENIVKKEEAEEMVTIIIDPKLTNGGLRTITDKGVVKRAGKVTVPASEAEDLLRRLTEYSATVQKLQDPSIKLRNQNIDQTRKSFIADPTQYGNNPQFNKVNGMADAFQLEPISEQDLKEWREERMGLFNY